MKKIAIITARAGSKGLPNKNVLLINGKPLIAYSIEAAIESNMFEHIIVSTDSQEYIDLLSHYPIEFIKRAEHLARDDASSFVVIEDVLQQYQHIDFDYFVLLQPTSPLRNATHIREACEKLERNFKEFDFLVSVSDAHKPTTITRVIDQDESLKNFKINYKNYTRQQYQSEYSPNGAIFLAKPKEYLEQKHFFGEKSLAYFMDKAVSLDIDDRLDFDYFYFVIQQRNREAILRDSIKQRIEYKKHLFSQSKEITFIGHSILDQWNINKIAGKTINNLAFSGIATQEYLEFIINKQLIKQLGSTVVLMIGTNDLTRFGWSNEAILNNIQLLVDKLKQINPDVTIYFLEITLTAFRADRNNQQITALNAYLKSHLKEIIWVELNNQFADKYHKLNLDYSNDGLHFNQKGYDLLEQILEKELSQ